MRWSINKGNLTWYEYGWAILPLGLIAVGGAFGGLFGGVAAAANLFSMRSNLRTLLKYTFTGAITLSAVLGYLFFAKMIVIAIGVTPDQVDRELQQNTAYVALKKADPELYKNMLDRLTKAARHKAPAEIQAVVRQTIDQALAARLPYTSEGALINFARALTLEIDQIGAKDAKACVQFVSPPGASTLDPTQYITADVLQFKQHTTVAILDSPLGKPELVPAPQEVNGSLNQVFGRLRAAYGEDAVSKLSNLSALDNVTACKLVSSLYKEVISLPRQQAVPLLRVLFAKRPSA